MRNNQVSNSTLTATNASMFPQPELIHIPNFFEITPFKWQGLNPHHSPSIRSVKDWILSHGSLDDAKQQRIVEAKCELFGAATYPYVDIDMLHIVNDSVVIVLVLDDLTGELDFEGTIALKESALNAMTGKTPDDHSFVANFMRDFMERLTAASIGLDTVLDRFLQSFDAYMEAMALEAKHRETGIVLPVNDYVIHRRENSSIRFYHIFIEIGLRINFPPEVLNDPNFIKANNLGIDLSSIINDVYSFAAEYYHDIEDNTIVSAFMNEKKCTVQEAMVYTESYYKDTLLSFLICRSRIKSYGPETDKAIEKYMSAVEQFVWGGAEWSLDNNRYWEVGTNIRQTYSFELKKQKQK